jgi:hypothetical protein
LVDIYEEHQVVMNFAFWKGINNEMDA